MRTIKLLFVLVCTLFVSSLCAQEVNTNQNGDEKFEGVKIKSRNYTRAKTGFFAPSDMSLGLAYDIETLRFSYNNLSTKPLIGGRLNYVIHGALSRKGALSLECPISLRVNYAKDSNLGEKYEYLQRWDFGGSFGILLSTGYCFSEKCYLTIGAGVLLYFFADESTLKYTSGEKNVIGNLGTEKSLTKLFDVPIGFSASFRYKRIGVLVNYDIGTINRYNKDYYKVTGAPDEHSQKNNHFCVGVQYYFM